MFKLKAGTATLLATATFAWTLPTAAQVFQIANSTSGSQSAAAPINQALGDVTNYIKNVEAANSNGRVVGTWQGSWSSGQGDQFQSGWSNGICISGLSPEWIYNKVSNLTFIVACPAGSGAYM